MSSHDENIKRLDLYSNQWWERRGTMIYGEDNGPGTAPFICELPSVEAAQSMVDIHNAALKLHLNLD